MPYTDLHRVKTDLAAAQDALERHKRQRCLDPDWWTDLRELQSQVARLSQQVRELMECCKSSAA